MFLHPQVSLNAIGVLTCTLFVSLIFQVSYCIFNFLNKVDSTHDILSCSIFFLEQGQKTDLLQRAGLGIPEDHGHSSTKIRALHSNPISSQNQSTP